MNSKADLKFAMKHVFFLLGAILLAVSLLRCSLSNGDGDMLEIHLQSSFAGERVRVELDGQTVFDGHAQTNHLIGLAEVIRLEQKEGTHRIRVDVNHRYSAEQQFLLKDRLFIGIEFYPSSIPEAGINAGLHFRFSETYFGYD